ncbi:hypothetical protein NUACC26_056160 [Scytonema sp. NUACC26]
MKVSPELTIQLRSHSTANFQDFLYVQPELAQQAIPQLARSLKFFLSTQMYYYRAIALYQLRHLCWYASTKIERSPVPVA